MNQFCVQHWSNLLSNINLSDGTFCDNVGGAWILLIHISFAVIKHCLHLVLTPLSLVESLNYVPSSLTESQGSQDDIRIEAAHVISSISYGELISICQWSYQAHISCIGQIICDNSECTHAISISACWQTGCGVLRAC